ncbi:ATP-binding protein [Microbacteriaceae bacterium K1510]|nr:ATP-binding protein [Microbacteriaceae bacterium K1510]
MTILIVVAGLIAAGITYQWAFHEAIELQDSVLTQMGEIAVAGAQQRDDTSDSKLEPEARVAIVEIDTAHPTPETQALGALPDGFHIVPRSGQDWRFLLITRDNNSRLAIGQPAEVREQIARTSAFHILIPLAVLIPFLMLIVGVVIGQTLRPMARLAGELDRSGTRELDPLPSQGMPSELQPFVASINRLLERVHSMVEQQRRFIADAAHELRTPITALSVQADNLTHAELPSEGRKRLAALREGARRTAHLLDQLLALARSELAEAKTLPITQIDQYAKEIMADLIPQARERGVDLGFEALSAVAVQADPIMVATLIRNLIDNAIRYTPDGGRVDVRLYQKDNLAVFEVEDSGPGIPPDDLARVFEPFFRGSSPVESGTGLGLSIVKRVVDRLRGTIQLENKPVSAGSGLRAVVTFSAYRVA